VATWGESPTPRRVQQRFLLDPSVQIGEGLSQWAWYRSWTCPDGEMRMVKQSGTETRFLRQVLVLVGVVGGRTREHFPGSLSCADQEFVRVIDIV
jgi:hypothetical protein